jgi:hypothetical protein
MQSKWVYFTTGIMAGIIAVLLTVVLAQNREPQAWAAPATFQGTDNTGQGLMMSTGGSQSQIQDILWIVYKRQQPIKGDREGALSKSERITLCCYQVENGARKMKLVGVRDISFDVDLLELENDKPSVKEIVEAIKKNTPKEK